MNHIRIVLVNTSHPGNIGAAARAMMTMGLSRLYLVRPKEFPHHEATARAAGADELLANAVIADTLEHAIADCELVFGTSARSRHLPWPLLHPRECAERVAAHSNQQIAIVFGNERIGLQNEELMLCNYHVRIPTNENYSSLNLAAAVQILAYEIAVKHNEALANVSPETLFPLATNEELTGLYHHFEKVFVELDFLKPGAPKLLMQRVKRLFNRVQLERDELNLLRGMLSAMEKKL